MIIFFIQCYLKSKFDKEINKQFKDELHKIFKYIQRMYLKDVLGIFPQKVLLESFQIATFKRPQKNNLNSHVYICVIVYRSM